MRGMATLMRGMATISHQTVDGLPRVGDAEQVADGVVDLIVLLVLVHMWTGQGKVAIGLQGRQCLLIFKILIH